MQIRPLIQLLVLQKPFIVCDWPGEALSYTISGSSSVVLALSKLIFSFSYSLVSVEILILDTFSGHFVSNVWEFRNFLFFLCIKL